MRAMKESYHAVLDDAFFRQTFLDKTIDVVAPASGTALENIKKLRLLDLNLHMPEDMLAHAIIYHANTDQKRFSFLEEALFNIEQHRIIWVLRGGYGSARLIENLRFLPKPIQRKYFIGCSDITALHLFLSQAWGWKTIHGSVLQGLLKPKQDSDNFLRMAAIVAGAQKSTIEDLQPMNPQAAALKQVSGLLTGGNLTLVQTSIGTAWQIQSQDKIVFLEDTAEPGYKIDRTLTQLRQAGILQGVRAIVLGDFEENDPEKPDVHVALARFAQEVTMPVFKSDAFGHGLKNYPLVYNSEARIHPAATQGSFELLMKF